MKPMRMDKWLWAARFFKTRALAAKACDLNRVTSNGHAAKPAREVRVGDSLVIKNEIGEFTVSVLQLSELRGSAAVAFFISSCTATRARCSSSPDTPRSPDRKDFCALTLRAI
jgi:ribosomal 50S subunit-recycling heat shock protein